MSIKPAAARALRRPRPRTPHDRQGPPRLPRSENDPAARRDGGRRAARRGQELITPGDRRIHRLLAFGEIARADGREQDVVLESAEQILGRQHFDPRGRELEGERQGIEPSTNRRHGGAVRGREAKVRLHVPNPLHEEPHRGSARQIGGRHRVRRPPPTRAVRRRSPALLAHGAGRGWWPALGATRPMSGDPRPAAPRPAPARNCRAPATSGDPRTRRVRASASRAP